MTKRFAIFASGTGSNAASLMERAEQDANCVVSFVLTDQKDAGVIDKARFYNIPVELCPILKKDGQDFSQAKIEQEKLVSKLVHKYQCDYILLAGYMRILSSDFVNEFEGRVINIHPSLLPQFPGKDGYGDAFKAGVTESGISIHFVDSGVDSGPMILQRKFPRKEGDDLDSFKKRGLRLEHEMYPQVMQWLALDKIVLHPNKQVELRIEA